MKTKKIPLIIINPSFWSKDGHYPHEKLANLMAQASNGKLIKFKGSSETKAFSETEVSQIFSEIEKFVT